jgi:hypothetical protein
VIVDGFFEWQKRDETKQPFFVRRDDGRPFALAGIWDCSTTPHGERIDSCAVITGDSKGAMAELHNQSRPSGEYRLPRGEHFRTAYFAGFPFSAPSPASSCSMVGRLPLSRAGSFSRSL